MQLETVLGVIPPTCGIWNAYAYTILKLQESSMRGGGQDGRRVRECIYIFAAFLLQRLHENGLRVKFKDESKYKYLTWQHSTQKNGGSIY